ncbi:hypothetical protein StoSoilB22_21830 [Arthrobacter sp. StoSoilB22]|nr:hypothetical protein StoSoilB22_21830 [Arthrobacter sp. StoSoilB22]
MLTLRPKSTIPARIRCFPAKSRPGRARPAARIAVPGIFAESSPKATASVIAGTAGKTLWIAKARPVAAMLRTKPGPSRDKRGAGLLKGMPQPCRMGARKANREHPETATQPARNALDSKR